MLLNLSFSLPGDGLHNARLLGHGLLRQLCVLDSDIADSEIMIGELCALAIQCDNSKSQGVPQSHIYVTLQYCTNQVVFTLMKHARCERTEDEGCFWNNALKWLADLGGTKQAAPLNVEEWLASADYPRQLSLCLVKSVVDRLVVKQADPRTGFISAHKRLHYRTEADALRAIAWARSSQCPRWIQTDRGDFLSVPSVG